MNAFEFTAAGRIVFGKGTSAQLPAIVGAFGERPLIVTGRRGVELPGLAGSRYAVAQEPTIAIVREGVAAFRDSACDCVVAIGGGSAIDAGKAISAIAANSGDLLDLEVIGRAQPLENAPYPFVAVPTTAGTGSEVTRNAVLGSPEHGVKVSLRSPLMLPRVAVVDPLLTLDLPPALTASTGMDAVTQLIEPYVSVRANPFVDNLCLDGLRRAAFNLPRAYTEGRNEEARAAMAYAGLLGGLALTNAGLGVVHGIAAPAGGMFDAPHGAVCAALLPAAIEINVRAVRERKAWTALDRYRDVARILWNDPLRGADDASEAVRALTRHLSIPSLGAYGIRAGDVPILAEKAARANSMKGNPVELTPGEIRSVIEMSL